MSALAARLGDTLLARGWLDADQLDIAQAEVRAGRPLEQALAQLGFPNAVATLGTACTTDHVQKMFRFTDSVVFSFDGDAAGRRAAGRALEAALPHATDTDRKSVV